MDTERIKELATDVNNVAVAAFQSGKEHIEKPLLAKIEVLEAELEKHRWIPVSERLPEKKGFYLVCAELYRQPRVHRLNRQYKNNLCGRWLKATYWKPIILPEK